MYACTLIGIEVSKMEITLNSGYFVSIFNEHVIKLARGNLLCLSLMKRI